MDFEEAKYCRNVYGFVPDLVDPKDFLKNDVSVEVVTGKTRKCLCFEVVGEVWKR
jgi:hypothetical protein